MNSTEQAGATIGNWADMQKRMWDEWYGRSPAPGSGVAPQAMAGRRRQ